MQTEADRIAGARNQPQGCMVERFWITDAAGLYYAGEGEFAYEPDMAIQFLDEDEAQEISVATPGTTVERFERWSRFPDLVVDVKDRALSEALNYVQHWRRDRDCNMAPSLETLCHVETVLQNAIAYAGRV